MALSVQLPGQTCTHRLMYGGEEKKVNTLLLEEEDPTKVQEAVTSMCSLEGRSIVYVRSAKPAIFLIFGCRIIGTNEKNGLHEERKQFRGLVSCLATINVFDSPLLTLTAGSLKPHQNVIENFDQLLKNQDLQAVQHIP